MHLSFFENLNYVDAARADPAPGPAWCSERFEDRVPPHVTVLRAKSPFRAFVTYARHIHDDALRPQSGFGLSGIAAFGRDPSHRASGGWSYRRSAGGDRSGRRDRRRHGDRLRRGDRRRRQDRPRLQYRRRHHHPVRADRQQRPDPSRLPDRPGRLRLHLRGQTHQKVPQIGRVIIQNDVEIGAGTTVDRGGLRDTVIGEGTKIDNQVQVGHNVTIGRHCVIAAQCGLAGSLTLGDNVALGAKVGINNHVDDRRRRADHRDERGQGQRAARRALGRLLREADQAMVPRNPRGRAIGAGRCAGRGTEVRRRQR